MTSYKFALRSSKSTLKTGQDIHMCHIVVLNDKGLFKVHPVSNFLYTKRGAKYNTLKSRGQIITSFLNWLNKNIFIFDESEARLSTLDFFKVEYYLNQLVSENKSAVTINHNILVLRDFLFYLVEIRVINNPSTVSEIQTRKVDRFNNFFDLYSKPNSSESDDLIHEIHPNYIIEFLQLAYKYTNPIALGVYMQFFGGLRRGDVVNLTRSSLKSRGAYGELGLEAIIRNRNLRPDLIDSDGTNDVKKPRNQVIFSNKLLAKFYESHLKSYKDNSGNNALFVDSNKMPMSGATYQYYFNKLKSIFIEKLLKSNNIEVSTYGLYLDSKQWSTHIGRGTFSNWVAETTSNPLDVAIARGDKSVESSLVYMEKSKTFLDGVNKVINSMYDEAWFSE
ncbi:hypothetical protein ACKXGF_02580 [Alkalibacillus sp. S2W]|uniref:hypothetical protein n=1 Tax=Alkalibacillus sp. S2W TaxID=3386553 RepID=UPI00398CF336